MSDDFWRWAGKALGQAQQTFAEAQQEAERLARRAGATARTIAADATQGVAETVADLAGADSPMAQAAAQLHAQVAGPPVEPIELAALPEQLRIAYAGALFALAAADDALDKDELRLIVDLIDTDGLSEAGRRMLLGFLITPPALRDTLEPFAFTDSTLRYALLLNLIEVAWANDLLSETQAQLLELARISLAISEPQALAIQHFAAELRAVRLRGLDDRQAAEITTNAAAGLAAVGVPLAAVYVSGSVIGLSAAGITSGLAALGLGLGMVPGIGVVALLGAGIFLSVRWLLHTSAQPGREQLQAEALRKTGIRLVWLNDGAALLAQEITRASNQPELSAAQWLQIGQLHERQRALQQLAAQAS